MAVAFGLSVCGCTVFGEQFETGDSDEDAEPSVAAPVTNPVAYDVQLVGDVPEGTHGTLEASLALFTEMERPPASVAALSKRADNDVGRAQEVLAADGYYEANVSVDINADVEPAQVVLDIQPGPQYHLGGVDIAYRPVEPVTDVPRTAAEIGLKIGEGAVGASLVEAERRLVRQLKENGYPNATFADRQYLANRQTQTIRAVLTVNTGPFARFGPLTFVGLDHVDVGYVERIADWHNGRTYDIRQIEKVRQSLAQTRLFATITSPPAGDVPVGEDGTVPVVFTLSEAKPRSIGAGAFYSTDEEGFGGSLSWEHRNLFGSGERLRLRLDGSQIRQEAKADFRKPAVGRLDQDLLANLGVERNQTDAYEGITGTGFVGLERRFGKYWTVNAGPAILYTDIKKSAGNDANDRYLLGGARTRLAYDSRDDPLDPTRGVLGSVALAPFASMALTSTQFMIGDAALAGYKGVLKNDRIVLAARGRLGSIVFADSNSTVPASQRFYAGGGGSVRGYAFQSVGPLVDNNDPIGGRSLVEVNAEVRIKVVDAFGIVPFIDGGQVYADEYPNLSEELQWAGGLGFRYYSPIGPVRLDFATPINSRSFDDSFQFYISIGQAF